MSGEFLRSGVKRLGSAFATVSLALATLVGAYVGASAVEALWLFWAIVPVASVVVVAYAGWPLVQKAVRFDSLLKAAGDQTAKVHALQKEIAQLQDARREDLARARQEGLRAAFGVVQAMSTPSEPTLVAVALVEGKVVLAAHFEGASPPQGALYAVWTTLVAVRQGIVEVADEPDPGGGRLLRCVHADVPAFWERLASVAVVNQEPPPGVSLRACTPEDVIDKEFSPWQPSL